MGKIKIDVIVGARPNYMKAAPVLRALGKRDCDTRFIHTGQHYDPKLSSDLFQNLGLPKEDINFHIGSGTHANQTAKVMMSYEECTNNWMPDITIVFGDVNSTLACALVAQKKGIDVVHVEAGCRSGDMSMPEEVNRIMVDHISKFLFCISEFDKENLKKENLINNQERVVKVAGDTMIDSLLACQESYDKSNIIDRLSLKKFLLCTIHRPFNVDIKENLLRTLKSLSKVAVNNRVVFPLHPRTKATLFNIDKNERERLSDNIIFTEPLNYFDFMKLQKNTECIITDSGSIQSEACAFGVPCLTMRDNTERPHTLEENGGTNQLVGSSPDNLELKISETLQKDWKKNIDCRESGEIIVKEIFKNIL